MKYKGRYRLRTEYDADLKSFPREFNGQFAESDVYIDCYKGIKIYHYGRGILQVYIPSIGRGHNILSAIKELEKTHTIYSGINKEKIQYIEEKGENLPIKQAFQEEIIFDVEETDEEILFKFHAKHMEELEPILRPKTSGASISPFSSKNLPKNKSYKIPDEEISEYKSIVENIPQNRILELTHTTNKYLKSLVNKRNTWDKIKADMALKGLKGKEYIHSIGKWSDYIKYLKKNLEDITNEN